MAEHGFTEVKARRASEDGHGTDNNHEDSAVDFMNDRFPQPYSRRKSEIIAAAARILPLTDSHDYSHHPARIKDDEQSGTESKSGTASRRLMSPSESGTEADDESFNYLKALPAPLSVANKGLRGAKEEETHLTPTQLAREVIQLSDLGILEFLEKQKDSVVKHRQQESQSKRVRRRRAEILRRVLEGALLAFCGALVLINQQALWLLSRAEKCMSGITLGF